MGQCAGEKVLQRGDLRRAHGSVRWAGGADRGPGAARQAVQLMERAGAMIDFVNVCNDSVSLLWSVMQLGSRCLALDGADLGALDRARMGAGGVAAGDAASDIDALVRSQILAQRVGSDHLKKKAARSAMSATAARQGVARAASERLEGGAA